MHRQSVFVFDHFLGALSGLLTKAEAHCTARNIAPEVILNFRLFPDMFPFTRQVQLSCDFAARGTARLAGAVPQSFADTETTFPELQARIVAARAYLASFDRTLFEGAATHDITFRSAGQDRVLPGADFLTLYSQPQFFFHASTAYNILRHNGVELGKLDFMGAA